MMASRAVRVPKTTTATPKSPDSPEERLLLRVDEAARLLGIGTTLAYELVGRGELPHVRLGRAVRVPRRELEAWIEAKTIGVPGAPQPPGKRP